ncbi:helix-turn-helix XRE domain protein [Syntrophotalea carbinolica DSM 2380]|uniref:Helix-turn-helix XRE domain protein n=1 Tax=Syntrophotalea carbinolica (strain DSM 2380 / NBRC 103641 / GraBd1) TaxID=338963 RepID=Q3A781_SYNC1|nr:helix-turn-helix transcriptional regulator [Syntrophotalea carbinolica]ABA87763.1 helix-turn-helix XRE domain protein [Syntrophotalea carbinolica DSM 2380]
MKRPDAKEMKRLRQEFFNDIEEGRITLAEATRRMRKILGMNRREYAEKVLKIGFETLQAVETGKGNPTLKTLKIIGAPFGLEVGFVRKKGE